MFGLKEKHNLVIMDGTDIERIKNIMGLIHMITKGYSVYSVQNVMHVADHMSMKVIIFKATKRDFSTIKKVIDGCYPALCCYDVLL